MQILIIGFQRSGTTLMRRIIHGHPNVKRIFHESFLLKRYQNKRLLVNFISSCGLNPKRDTWGEKVPFYPNLRKIPTLQYCDKWNEWFGNNSRILHIIRHPIDVSLSISKKYKVGNIKKSLIMYKTRMIKYIPEIESKPNTFTFKYEDLLINPDDIVPIIFEFCSIKKDVNFKKYLSIIKNPKYRTLNKSRAFAHKKEKNKPKVDLTDIYRIANTIDGPKYD